MTKKSLKFQLFFPYEYQNQLQLKEDELDVTKFNQFVDTILFNILRDPSIPLPENIDEIMQDSLGTYFLEYLYAQYGWQAIKNETCPNKSEFTSNRNSILCN